VIDPAAVYIVGVDAGATQTRTMLSSPDGEDLSFDTVGSFNLRHDSPKKLQNLIDDAVQQLIPREKRLTINVKAIGIGAAGVGTAEERESIQKLINSHFKCHVYVHHDAYTAHYGAFEGDAGVMVTSGTGSIAYGRNADGEEARAGGWGWLLGDEGSGWWIAQEALQASLAQWEGSGPETRITEVLIESFQVEDAYAIIPRLYADKIKRSDLTVLTEQFAEIARNGDEVASKIFSRAGGELANLALRAAKRLHIPPEELNVALLGGVATGARDLIEPGIVNVWESSPELSERGIPNIVEPITDALHGAVNWARNSLVRRSYA
jgi:N-acetylglucosamine kinase-like BadF-type ATPase